MFSEIAKWFYLERKRTIANSYVTVVVFFKSVMIIISSSQLHTLCFGCLKKRFHTRNQRQAQHCVTMLRYQWLMEASNWKKNAHIGVRCMVLFDRSNFCLLHYSWPCWFSPSNMCCNVRPYCCHHIPPSFGFARQRSFVTGYMPMLFWLWTNLVDPASSHMLVSKIKPCMSQYKPLHGKTVNGSLKQL